MLRLDCDYSADPLHNVIKGHYSCNAKFSPDIGALDKKDHVQSENI